MSQVTFIGGVADGRRIEDPELPYYRVSEDPLIPVYDPRMGFSSMPLLKVDRYRRETIRAMHGKWEGEMDIVFYVLDSMTTFQAITKLFSGYRRP